MQYDRRGLAVTTSNAAAVSHLDDAVRCFLAHRKDTALHIEKALAADPGLGLGRCFAELAQLLLGRSEVLPEVRVAAKLARASVRERGATRREERTLEALTWWLAGDMDACAATLEVSARDEPFDALSLKFAHAVRFMLGDARAMRRAADAAAKAWTEAVPDRGFILGCQGFASEEDGDLDAAERLAQEAIALEPEDVWARHAAIHVCGMRGQLKAGLALLEDYDARSGMVNNLAYHMHWHAALFHLARGDRAAAFDLYDRKVRHDHTDDYRDISNGVSLLWRFEQRGWNVGDRWGELADLAERRMDDGALVFAQLHYLLCLIGAGREGAAAKMLAAMRQRADWTTGTQAGILREVGVPLAELMARRMGDTGMLDKRDVPSPGAAPPWRQQPPAHHVWAHGRRAGTHVARYVRQCQFDATRRGRMTEQHPVSSE